MPHRPRTTYKRKRRLPKNQTTSTSTTVDVSNPFTDLPPPTWDAIPCTTKAIPDPVKEALASTSSVLDPFAKLPRDHPFNQEVCHKPSPPSTLTVQQTFFLRQNDLPDSHASEHSCFCKYPYCPFHN